MGQNLGKSIKNSSFDGIFRTKIFGEEFFFSSVAENSFQKYYFGGSFHSFTFRQFLLLLFIGMFVVDISGLFLSVDYDIFPWIYIVGIFFYGPLAIFLFVFSFFKLSKIPIIAKSVVLFSFVLFLLISGIYSILLSFEVTRFSYILCIGMLTLQNISLLTIGFINCSVIIFVFIILILDIPKYFSPVGYTHETLDNNFIFAFILQQVILSCIGVVIMFFHQKAARRMWISRLEIEKDTLKLQNVMKRNLNLLRKLLPSSMIERMEIIENTMIDSECKNALVGEKFEATVAFVKIQNYEELERKFSFTKILSIFNRYFSKFDQIISMSPGQYRIKTICETYFFTSGITERTEEHTKNTINSCLEIINHCKNMKNDDESEINVVIGIERGDDIVAGMIGNFEYDVWGGSCNISSRLSGIKIDFLKNVVYITENTYTYLKNNYKIDKSAFKKHKNVFLKGVGNVPCFSFSSDIMLNPINDESVETFDINEKNNKNKESDEDYLDFSVKNPSIVSISSKSEFDYLSKNGEALNLIFGSNSEELSSSFPFEKYNFSNRKEEMIMKRLVDCIPMKFVYNKPSFSSIKSINSNILNIFLLRFNDKEIHKLYRKKIAINSISINRLLYVLSIFCYVCLCFVDFAKYVSTNVDYLYFAQKTSYFQIIFHRFIVGLPSLVIGCAVLFSPCYNLSSLIFSCTSLFSYSIFIIVCYLGIILFGDGLDISPVWSFLIFIFTIGYGGISYIIKIFVLFSVIVIYVIHVVIDFGVEGLVIGSQMIIALVVVAFLCAEHVISIEIANMLEFYKKGLNKKQNIVTKIQENKTNQYIASILPLFIIKELKNIKKEHSKNINKSKIFSKFFESTSILSADICNFTQISQKLEALQLVACLNQVFVHFDQLAQLNDVIRLKLVGDCYVAAAIEGNNHAKRIALFSLDILNFLLNRNKIQNKEFPLKFRIGCHLGSLIAGLLISNERLSYELFGSTFHTADLYQSHCDEMKILVSEEFKNSFYHDKTQYKFLLKKKCINIKKEVVRAYWLIDTRKK